MKMSSSSSSSSSSNSQAWRSMISGAGAGTITTVLCAPLDVIKVRMQIQGSLGISKYSGNIIHTLRNIHIEEGVTGLFKGVGPALFTVPLFWGVYWPIYDAMKVHIEQSNAIGNTHLTHLVAAVTAGGIGDIITNPFWVTRTRIQALILHKNSNISAHVSMVGMMRTIYREEGFLAFYKGLAASFLGLSHVAIQFPLYEYFKKLARERSTQRTTTDGSSSGAPHKESFWEITGASVSAKLVASCITYPHEVLRARLQDTRATTATSAVCDGKSSAYVATPPTLRRVFLNIVQQEGVLSLWTGVHINFIRIVPATSAFFLSYEYISRYLQTVLPPL